MNGNDLVFAFIFICLICAIGGWAVIEFTLYLISFISITVG